MPLAPTQFGPAGSVPDADGQRRSIASALIETILKKTIIRTVKMRLLGKDQ
jgi:hypothetical protein